MMMVMQREGSAARVHRVNKRRIGKKAMTLCRTSLLLERKVAELPKQRRKFVISWRPARLHYALFASFVAVCVLGTAGYAYYQQQQSQVIQTATKIAEERAREASERSDECRKQKVAAKSDLLGKVTFDELYDYSVCDYSE